MRQIGTKKGPFLFDYFQKLYHSLAAKLIATIGISMVAVSLIFWFFLIEYQKKELLKNTLDNGTFFLEYVKKSTRYAMLTFQPEWIQRTVEGMGSAEGVINVRIYDDKCKIRYSSRKEEIGITGNKASPSCKGCHINPGKPSETLRSETKWKILEDANGNRILNIIQPIFNESPCYTAACHTHKKEHLTLGMVESNRALGRMDMLIKKQKVAIGIYAVSFTFAISLLLCVILWKFVSKPVAILIGHMERAGSGDLEHPVKIKSQDEMGVLADAFNAMLVDLKSTKQELLNWADILEKEVEKKTEEIQKSTAQLIKTEKLASLGRMAAGVAHEINNPLTGIVTFAHLLYNHTPADSPEQKDLAVIIEQANRCSKIIKGLLGFARATESDQTQTDINEVLDTALQMVNTKADFLNIHLDVKTDKTLSPITADPSQIQQVFLNILLNAVDAMEGRGTLSIVTRKVFENGKAFAEVEFRDTGPGIPEENLQKIFDPFFTTKPVGKGTGLGLSISHGIIEKHGGNIRVKSSPEGTSFFVRLPLEGEYGKA